MKILFKNKSTIDVTKDIGMSLCVAFKEAKMTNQTHYFWVLSDDNENPVICLNLLEVLSIY